jgi:signal transduction histidine kinase
MDFAASAFSNVDLLTVGVVVAFMAVLGAVVYFSNIRSASNIAFLFFCLAAVVWSVLNYAAFQTEHPSISFWIIRGVIAAAAWFVFALFLFLSTFPALKSPFRLTTRISMFLITLSVSVLNLSPLVFKKVTSLAADGSIATIENGPGIFLFAGFVLLCVVGGIGGFILKYFKTPENERAPMRVILMGIIATFALLLTFNFALPAFFDNPSFIKFGAVFIFPFIAAASLVLLRYRFLNAKAVTIALLTGFLAIAIFGEVVFSKDTHVLLYRLSEFLLVIIFGVLLIRGVTKEVQQREEIQHLADSLKAANARLKELDKLKSQFLSIASHDLRAPLTVIRNFLSLLMDGTYGKLPAAAAEGMHQVFDRATDMAKSVDTYLNVSRIEQGRMKYDFINVELVPMVENAFKAFAPNAEKKGLKFSLTVSDGLRGKKAKLDVAKMNEVLNNLLDNSIKYTPSGSISATFEPRGSVARLTISDTGVGMSAATIGKLFKLFSTGEESRKINTSSTGVGLYITKSHVEAHGGKIWAESDGEGKGSRFLLELPLI